MPLKGTRPPCLFPLNLENTKKVKSHMSNQLICLVKEKKKKNTNEWSCHLKANCRNYNPMDEKWCWLSCDEGGGWGLGRGAQLTGWLIRTDVRKTVQLTCPLFQRHPWGLGDPCRGLKEEIFITDQYRHQVVQHKEGNWRSQPAECSGIWVVAGEFAQL